MALRDDLVGLVDELRRDVVDQDMGLRLHSVQTVRRTWSGGEAGLGAASDEVTVLDPQPRVRPPSPRLLMSEAGTYRTGDRVVSKLSVTYSEDDLTGGALAAGVEFFWTLDGEPYRVVGQPEKRYLEWRVQLRPMRSRPA